MKAVWLLWVIFSLIFFGGGYIWQNKSAIASNLLKHHVQTTLEDKFNLDEIINLERNVIEGGGLKYLPPSFNTLDLHNREDRLLLDSLTLPKDRDEVEEESPIMYILPENVKERYNKIFKFNPRYEFPSFGPNTIFDDPAIGLMRLNQQIDTGPVVVSLVGSWNNPTFNIIPDYSFPVKLTYYGAMTDEGVKNSVTISYTDQLYDGLYMTSSILYGDEIGMNLGVNYKQGYVNIQQTEHLSLNGGYRSQF